MVHPASASRLLLPASSFGVFSTTMASSYSLPGAVVHSHRHHGHGHSHTRSRSPSFGTLNRSFKMDLTSAPTNGPDLDEHDHEHDHTHPTHSHSGSGSGSGSGSHSHNHSHSHSHDHEHDESRLHSHSLSNHSNHRANLNQPRHNLPPLSPSAGWSTSSAGGRPLITPTNPTFAGIYEAPQAQAQAQAPAPDAVHDHSAERSGFTKMLLPYTSKWPLLHAVMTEKDSRRIFYFMRCVRVVILAFFRTTGLSKY